MTNMTKGRFIYCTIYLVYNRGRDGSFKKTEELIGGLLAAGFYGIKISPYDLRTYDFNHFCVNRTIASTLNRTHHLPSFTSSEAGSHSILNP